MLSLILVAGLSPTVPGALTVCLIVSPLLAISGREEAALLAEAIAVWRPHGLAIRMKGRNDGSCDRLITVRSDREAQPGDESTETALGWVPFVEGHARQLVFLRVPLARAMIRQFVPGTRSASLADVLLPKFLGRILAHELGHVLLNTADHATTGLMRDRYQANDVLREPSSAYTLSAAQRDRLTSIFHSRLTLQAR